jgi:hypothetical protein
MHTYITVVQVKSICDAVSEYSQSAGDHMAVFMIRQLLTMNCAAEYVHTSI